VARPAPPSDDGSPARLIATMVGIVGILLLGSLAWSAVGALVSAVGAAGSAVTSAVNPRAASTLGPVAAVTPSAIAVAALTLEPTLLPTLAATGTAVPAATATVASTPTAEPAATPTTATSARNPWILLPQPEPGAKVTTGQVVVEARARGDVAIKAMRLELDGAALPAALEQRSESTWRASANTRVAPGPHDVRASVTDVEGRTGSFKWSFTVAPAP
jgi:hypothetical protein